MRIYKLGVSNEPHKWLLPHSSEDNETLLEMDGREFGKKWPGLSVDVLEKDAERKVRLIDADSLHLAGNVVVFSEFAFRALEKELEGAGEILEMNIKGKTDRRYLLYNVTAVMDVLDKDAAEIQRFRDGRVMRVKRYAFNMGDKDMPSLFKIPETGKMEIFATERFEEAVRMSGLTGIELDMVFEL